MAEYTYSQLSQMQREATERVLEMRKRAKKAVEDAGKNKEQPANNSACRPQDDSCENNGTAKVPVMPCCQRKANDRNLIGKLFGSGITGTEDADKALLLSLCFLLQAEKADEELILALLYVLT